MGNIVGMERYRGLAREEEEEREWLGTPRTLHLQMIGFRLDRLGVSANVLTRSLVAIRN